MTILHVIGEGICMMKHKWLLYSAIFINFAVSIGYYIYH